MKKKLTGIEQLQNMNKKEPRKLHKIVLAVLFYWLAFVAIAWITFWVKDSVPDTLIQYGLGGGACELIVTGFIEVMKERIARKESNNEMDS